MKDFIEIYDNVLPKEKTEKLIHHFEKDPFKEQQVGTTNGGPPINNKVSTDITYDFYDRGELASNIIGPYLINCMENYYEKNYTDGIDCINEFLVYPYYNIQRYKPGEGYHQRHCECAGLGKELDRVMVWMIYLNDVKSGGRTIFPTQNKKIKARRGRLVIWPAYWPWSHYGETSKKETKYVATGWFVFKQ